MLGIGVGWMREEFDAIGASFDDRGARADEYVAVMRELWTSDSPTFHGEFINFDNTYCRPQPAQGSVPIIIGGDSKVAARRAGRLGDGYFPLGVHPRNCSTWFAPPLKNTGATLTRSSSLLPSQTT